jgi:hemin uptake protein HemP
MIDAREAEPPADDRPDVPLAARRADVGGIRRLFSSMLFRGDREVVIVHNREEYRLRITRADKLILTK